MKIEIDHLGIAVDDLAESLKFYCELLGFPLAAREAVTGEQVDVALLPAGGSNARIELLSATSAESPVGRFLARRGAGIHHLALRVDDLAAAVERLNAAGCVWVDPATSSGAFKTGAGGHRYVFIHPRFAGGVLLELVEQAPAGTPARQLDL